MPNKRKEQDIFDRVSPYLEQAVRSALPITDVALIEVSDVSKPTFHKWTKRGTRLHDVIEQARRDQENFLQRSADPHTRAGQRATIIALRVRVDSLEEQLRGYVAREAAILDTLRREYGFDAGALHDLQSARLEEAEHLVPGKRKVRSKGKPSPRRRLPDRVRGG